MEAFILKNSVQSPRLEVELATCKFWFAFVGSLPSNGAGASSKEVKPRPESNKSYGSDIWSIVKFFVNETSNIPVKVNVEFKV